MSRICRALRFNDVYRVFNLFFVIVLLRHQHIVQLGFGSINE
jgi:hypothetical protein